MKGRFKIERLKRRRDKEKAAVIVITEVKNIH